MKTTLIPGMLAIVGLVSSAMAVEIDVTWIGPNNGNWSTAENWSPEVGGGQGPRNAGTVEFNVTIPENMGHVHVDSAVGECVITRLTLGNNTTLHAHADSTMTVLADAQLCGIIDADDNFVADHSTLVAFSCDRARVYASDGAEATIAAPEYSAHGLWAHDASGIGDPVYTFHWNLITATGTHPDTGAPTLLDLSSVESIDAGFDSYGNDNDQQKITASSGARIDLSAVHTITSPFDHNDRIEINVIGEDSEIDLSSLQTIMSASKGSTRIDVSDGAQLLLPFLQIAHQVVLDVNGGASVIAAGTEPASFISTGFWLHDAVGIGDPVYTFNWNLITATGTHPDTGAPTLLDLSSVESIDAGFDSYGNDNDQQKITASDGTVIDLSDVEIITAPTDGNDRLEFMASEDSLIDLSSLTTINSTGSGQVWFTLSSGGELRTGPWQAVSAGMQISPANTTPEMNGTTTLHVGGDLRAPLSPGVTVSLGSDSLLDVDGGLLLGSTVTIPNGVGAAVNVGGRYCHGRSEEAEVDLGFATVHFDGAGPQRVEVGGVDFDVNCAFLSDDNFGFGKMIVGQDGLATEVHLRDDLDNGNQGGNREALYLFGLGEERCVGAENGLEIRGGSTLVLNGMNVFVYVVDDGMHQNQWVHLNSLLPTGVDEIPYDGGTIRRGTPTGPGDVNGDGCVDVDDLTAIILAWGGCPGGPMPCDADLDCDGEIEVDDLTMVILFWGCIE